MAAIGTQEFKRDYVREKVAKWTKDVEDLSVIAIDEPQAALSAYNNGLCQRWTFVQRTTNNISDLFKPLETAIKDKFIPAICGKSVDVMERRIIALPYRYGGMGIQKPVQTADREFRISVEITSPLMDIIFQQIDDVSALDNDVVKDKRS